ncbi:MAG: glycine cleavage system protein H [Methylotenera sp. RIFCSPLOWO2_02_FULL_45_14]|nr:MAG: glycine cleavage system protein H [Methylotenera sp. RIFCSPLOWO2_02_FULL_45_14]
MSKIRYTEEHEWLLIGDDALVTVGITDFAQEQLGDLVYIQLPEIGKAIAKGEEAAVIESVKSASEIMMPVTGVIVEVNTILIDEPGKVNDDPMGKGWFIKLKMNGPSELDGLMDEPAYTAFVKDLG